MSLPRRTRWQVWRRRAMQVFIEEMRHLDFETFCTEQAREELSRCETVLLATVESPVQQLIAWCDPARTRPLSAPRRIRLLPYDENNQEVA